MTDEIDNVAADNNPAPTNETTPIEEPQAQKAVAEGQEPQEAVPEAPAPITLEDPTKDLVADDLDSWMNSMMTIQI